MKNTILIIAASLTVAASSQAALVADLHADYTGADFSGATAGVTTFTTNNWSFLSNSSAMTWDADLAGSGSAGFTGGLLGFDLPLVSADGVFDGASPSAGELTFHNAASGAAGDLVMRWTADQDYATIDFGYSLRRNLAGGNIGLAIRKNAGAFDLNNNGVATTDVASTINYTSFTSGDYVEVIIYAGADNSYGGDQSFGNFTVNGTAVPEPSSAALLGLGGLALILRRRK